MRALQGKAVTRRVRAQAVNRIRRNYVSCMLATAWKQQLSHMQCVLLIDSTIRVDSRTLTKPLLRGGEHIPVDGPEYRGKQCAVRTQQSLEINCGGAEGCYGILLVVTQL
jgi:hypothetical protein